MNKYFHGISPQNIDSGQTKNSDTNDSLNKNFDFTPNTSTNNPLYPTSKENEQIDNKKEDINTQDIFPYNGIGSLVIQAFSAEQAIPIENVKVTITSNEPQTKNIKEVQYTNSSGRTEPVSLPTPSLYLSNQSQENVRPYATYNVTGEKEGYTYVYAPKETIVFDQIESIQNIELIPKRESED